MANVLLGVTGSVAAIYTAELYHDLHAAGHEVKIVATTASLYFFDRGGLPTGSVFLDEDEWPGERYERGQPVLHIELRRWADLYLIAPLDANTLAKLAGGLADNCLTCVYRAWDPARPIVVAPAMNTLMWQHPSTARQLRTLEADAAPGKLSVVSPITKALACADVGQGAMAERPALLAAVREALGPWLAATR